jgi:4-amino-4-deoxy-L-arabinose transferase-like glycosyltransferase
MILGAAVRLAYVMDIPHYIDNAYPIWQALLVLDDGFFPLTGQMASVGLPNPPLTSYLYLPLVALTRSPLPVYIAVILLNTLAVWFCYRLTRRLFGEKEAVFAAWLVAVNPWLIEYSRFTWVQALMPFFMTGLAWLMYPLLLGQAANRFRRTLLVVLLVTLIAGTYVLAFLLLLPVGVLMMIFYRRVSWRAVVVGGVVFALMFGLFAVGALPQFNPATATLVNEVSPSTAALNPVALNHAFRFVTGAEYAVRTGDAPELNRTLEQLLVLPIFLAVMAGVGAALVAIWKKTPVKRDLAVILLVWSALTILPLSYNSQPVQVHYQMMTFPAGYVLAAWGASFLLNRQRVWSIAFVVLIPFSALMTLNSLRYTSQVAAERGSQTLVRPPLGMGQYVAAQIDASLPEGGTVYIDTLPEILTSLGGKLFPVVRYNWEQPVTVIPSAGAVYVASARRDETLPAQPPLSRPGETWMAENGTQFALYTYPPSLDVSGVGETVNLPTQQGLTLVTYTLTSNQRGNNWLLTTYWRVDSIPSQPGNFRPITHVLLDDAAPFTIEGSAVPTASWRIGDLHIHRARFNTQRSAFTLNVGMSDPERDEPLIFLMPEEASFIEIAGEATDE